MPSTAERRALVLVTVVACLGVVARVSRATRARPQPSPAEQQALDRQIARVESARAAKRIAGGRGNNRGAGATEGFSRAPRTRAKRGSAPDTGDTRAGAMRDVRPIVIDLDVASETEIERLPHVGRVLAARIVANRDSCGGFGSIEGLKRVFGIGDGVARRLAPFVTFSSGSSPLGTVQRASCLSADTRAALRRRGRRR
jgi:hypothetical protein